MELYSCKTSGVALSGALDAPDDGRTVFELVYMAGGLSVWRTAATKQIECDYS